jgi:hypothetical protein
MGNQNSKFEQYSIRHPEMERRERLISISLPANHQSADIPLASEALEALRRTGILKHHPRINIQVELEMSRCSVETCNAFGAYLFLPTCQRVCNLCIHKNAAFNIMALPVAAKLFNIPVDDILNSEVPILQAIGGSYQIQGLYNSVEDNERLVCTEQVKEMCLRRRSLVSVQNLHSSSIDNQDPMSYNLGLWILFDVSFQQSIGKLAKEERSQDWHTAAGCIPFPCVDDKGSVRKSYRCGACEQAFWECSEMHNLRGPKWNMLAQLFDIEDRIKGTVEGYDEVALIVGKSYLREDFELHVANCLCLKWLKGTVAAFD